MASKFLPNILRKSVNFAFSTSKTANANLLRVKAFQTASGTAEEKPTRTRNNLISRIIPLGDPRAGLTPVLDRWVAEGRELNLRDLHRVVQFLRSRGRYSQALEVSEWMSGKGIVSSSTGEMAIHLNLIGRVRGLDFAESYFNSVKNQDKDGKIYGALLNCYVREGLVDRSLSLMKKMKELGIAFNTLTYNNLMCLYLKSGQLDKVPSILSEMKENNVARDNLSYRICISAYGQRSYFDKMEEVLEEMKGDLGISVDWLTYSVVASSYVKEGLKEKALIYLKKCEKKVHRNSLGYNHLITLYASLGDKDKVLKLWSAQKAMCTKLTNNDNMVMMGSLVKLGELEEAEKFLSEWESLCKTYDFRVPNALLIGYCQKGLVEKAEEMLRDIVNRREFAIPNSWSIITAGYIDKRNMEKAFECFKEALALQSESTEWRPKPHLISSILSWLGDHGDVDAVEAFVKLLKNEVEMKKEMYHALIKTYIRYRKEVDLLLENMKADGIDVDDETKQILSSS